MPLRPPAHAHALVSHVLPATQYEMAVALFAQGLQRAHPLPFQNVLAGHTHVVVSCSAVPFWQTPVSWAGYGQDVLQGTHAPPALK